MLSLVPLGGCPLNIPLKRLYRRKLLTSAFREAGFKEWPLALSSADAAQLVQFGLGRIDIPERLNRFCYRDPNGGPAPSGSEAFSRAAFILVEMSTPVVIMFGGHVMNHNHFNNFLKQCSADDPQDIQRELMVWRYQGLQLQDEAKRAALAAKLLGHYSAKPDTPEILLELIERARGRSLTAGDMTNDLAAIRAALKLPMAIVLHHYNYLPGARPVSFPANFLADTMEVAKRLGVPFYDPAPLVQRHGTDAAMEADMRHYKKDFNEIVADEYLRFLIRVSEEA